MPASTALRKEQKQDQVHLSENEPPGRVHRDFQVRHIRDFGNRCHAGIALS